MTTITEILEAANTNLSELAIAQHKKDYINLVVLIKDDKVIGAATVDSKEQYSNEWHLLYAAGTGSVPCNCDACLAGDAPEEWAGKDGLNDLETELEGRLKQLLNHI